MAFRRVLFGLVAAIVLGGMVPTASATIITIDLDTEFSGATPPAGGTPWATATLDDGGGSGSVSLTMSTSGLVGTEFLSKWFFNVDVANPALVGVAAVDDSDLSGWTTTLGLNCCKADGDGFFDIRFDFGSNNFTSGETASFLFTFPGLTADSFAVLSLGAGNSQDGLYSAAHVQSIGATGANSGWITGDLDREPHQTAPEPGGLLILGAGLISLNWMRRSMRSKK